MLTTFISKISQELSALTLVAVLWCIFELIFQYQFGHAYTILVTYGILFALLILVIRPEDGPRAVPTSRYGEWFVFLGAATYFVYAGISRYGPQLLEAPILDIGYNTVDAARIFLTEGRNPYVPDKLFIWGSVERFWGYHYGPFMFLGYFASAFLGGVAFKYTALFYLLGITLSTILIYHKIAPKEDPRLGGITFIILALVMGGFVGWDLAIGINDYLPVLLILLAILFLSYGKWFGCGMILGLAISAKFVPSILVTALLVRKGTPFCYYLGVVLGCTVMLPFLLWEPHHFIDNVFLFHSTKPHDDSSIYNLTPSELHWVFPILQLGICVLFWLRNVTRKLSIHDLLFDYVRLNMFVNILFKETHRNHFWWMVPSMAILFAVHRYRFLPKLQGTVTNFVAPKES